MAQGARSVQYAHIPGEKTRYPIWVIELWAKLTSLKEQQAPWTGVERWLQSQAHTAEDAEQVKAVLAVMGNVPYDMKKTAFSDGKPIYDLWRLLGNNWTNSTDIDNMLDFLRLQISFVVLPVHFTEKLTQAIESSHRGQRDGRTWRWLQKIGEQVFTEGKTILTVVHLGTSMDAAHWVPLAFDGSQNLLLYGDSLDLGATVPSPILSTYRSWAALYSQQPLCTDKLSVATQQDGHSCGPLAANALRNFVLNNPLVESSRVGFERMKIFHEIVLETLCHVCCKTPKLLAAPAHLVLQQVKPGLIDGQVNDSDSTTGRKRKQEKEKIFFSTKRLKLECKQDQGEFSDEDSLYDDQDEEEYDQDEEEYDQDEEEGAIMGKNGYAVVDAAIQLIEELQITDKIPTHIGGDAEAKEVKKELREINEVIQSERIIQVEEEDNGDELDEVDGVDIIEDGVDDEGDLIEELSPATRKAYRAGMKRFENYLKLNGLYVGSKSIFELEDAPQDTPIWIRTWIGTTCDPFYIAKSSHPS
ncbi:hypothetical protein GG344DRAFT_71559, partial [Lentinula edodes]